MHWPGEILFFDGMHGVTVEYTVQCFSATDMHDQRVPVRLGEALELEVSLHSAVYSFYIGGTQECRGDGRVVFHQQHRQAPDLFRERVSQQNVCHYSHSHSNIVTAVSKERAIYLSHRPVQAHSTLQHRHRAHRQQLPQSAHT